LDNFFLLGHGWSKRISEGLGYIVFVVGMEGKFEAACTLASWMLIGLLLWLILKAV
jgi:hypothetical protein